MRRDDAMVEPLRAQLAAQGVPNLLAAGAGFAGTDCAVGTDALLGALLGSELVTEFARLKRGEWVESSRAVHP